MRIAARRGKAMAVVALARRLAGILFALWRDGTEFDLGRRMAAAGVIAYMGEFILPMSASSIARAGERGITSGCPESR